MFPVSNVPGDVIGKGDGIFNLNNCNYNIHINMNTKKNYCLILITISKYNN